MVNHSGVEDENLSPSSTKVLYPDLTNGIFVEPEAYAFASAKLATKRKFSIPTTPANIARRRLSRTAALVSSPPRESYSAKVSGIFAPKPKPLSDTSPGKRILRLRSRTNISLPEPTSKCQPEDDLVSPTDSHHADDDTNDISSSSSSSSDEDPLDDLERAVELSSSPDPMIDILPPPAPPSTPTICSLERTIETSYSSDEWTGDEIFMPRSARLRHRQERLAMRQQQEDHAEMGNVLTTPPVYTAKKEPKTLLKEARSSTVKASRFQRIFAGKVKGRLD